MVVKKKKKNPKVKNYEFERQGRKPKKKHKKEEVRQIENKQQYGRLNPRLIQN